MSIAKNFTWRPQPHMLDLRSLKLLRILLGLYACYDVVTRLLPFPYSICWYSSDPNCSFLDPHDTPHKSPVHKLWFYRGSTIFQYTNFGFIFILGALFGLGKISNRWYLQLFLWIAVVGMQCRNMSVHDGSDTFFRQILLWFILIPTHLQLRIDATSFRTFQNHPSSSVVFLGLVLQTALMYLGTVAKRTIDNFDEPDFEYSWLPPKLDAVYYIMRDVFAVRDESFMVQGVRSLPLWCTQIMTLVAMIGELSAFIWVLLPGNSKWRFGAFITYFKLHFGMLLMMRLPNWQFLAISTSTIWIPCCVWNKIATNFPAVAHKKDDDAHLDSEEDTDIHAQGSPIRRILTYFFLSYMVYNFCGTRGWIDKHDGGDIGELFRVSQTWVMYSTVPKNRCRPRLLQYSSFENGTTTNAYDAMRGIRTGLWEKVGKSEIDESGSGLEIFVSARWERALAQFGRPSQKQRARRFLKGLCAAKAYHADGSEQVQLRLDWRCEDVPPPSELSGSQYFEPRKSSYGVKRNC